MVFPLAVVNLCIATVDLPIFAAFTVAFADLVWISPDISPIC